MSRILTREQYDWAVARVEELLPQVGEDSLSFTLTLASCSVSRKG